MRVPPFKKNPPCRPIRPMSFSLQSPPKKPPSPNHFLRTRLPAVCLGEKALRAPRPMWAPLRRPQLLNWKGFFSDEGLEFRSAPHFLPPVLPSFLLGKTLGQQVGGRYHHLFFFVVWEGHSCWRGGEDNNYGWFWSFVVWSWQSLCLTWSNKPLEP